MDHGTHYLSDHFIAELRRSGIAPSSTFVEEPQRNGVAKRFVGILHERVLKGRIFRNTEEARYALAELIERFNRHWVSRSWSS